MRTRRGSESSGYVEVLLDGQADDDHATGAVPGAVVDDGEAAPPGGASGSGGPGGARRPHAARRWRAVGFVAAALALVLVVGANVAEVRTDQARRERLAGQLGVVPSLAEPLSEAWRADGNLVVDLGPLLLVDGLDGMHAIDPATGETVWSLADAERAITDVEWCQPSGGPEVTDLESLRRPARDPDLLVCAPPVYGSSMTVERRISLLVVDARTGEVRHTLTTTGTPVGVENAGGDVALVLVTPHGAIRVVGWDVATGEQLFDTTTADAAFSPGTGSAGLLGWERRDDAMVVTGDVGDVAVDLTTGAEVEVTDDEEQMVSGEKLSLPDGWSMAWTWDEVGGHGRVLDEDGTTRYALDAPPLLPVVDDGSTPDVLLLRGRELSALDVRTGRALWSREVDQAMALVLADGTVVVSSGTRLLGVDVRSGTTVWETQTPAAGYPSTVTDGDRFLTTEPGTDGTTAVVTRSVASGEVVWRAGIDGVAWGATTTADGRVVVSTDGAVVGLG